jgi:hypothetical protein
MSSGNVGFVGRSLIVMSLGLTLAACTSLRTGTDFDHTMTSPATTLSPGCRANTTVQTILSWFSELGMRSNAALQARALAMSRIPPRRISSSTLRSGRTTERIFKPIRCPTQGRCIPGITAGGGIPIGDETSMCGSIVKARCRSTCLMCARTDPSGMVEQRRN